MAPYEVLVHQNPRHMKTMSKKHEITIRINFAITIFASNFYLLANSKQILSGKRFRSNEETISGTHVYFAFENKSLYKKFIEILK